MLFSITYKCNTNKLFKCWINECFQISHKLYNKHQTLLNSAKNTKMVDFSLF